MRQVELGHQGLELGQRSGAVEDHRRAAGGELQRVGSVRAAEVRDIDQTVVADHPKGGAAAAGVHRIGHQEVDRPPGVLLPKQGQAADPAGLPLEFVGEVDLEGVVDTVVEVASGRGVRVGREGLVGIEVSGPAVAALGGPELTQTAVLLAALEGVGDKTVEVAPPTVHMLADRECHRLGPGLLIGVIGLDVSEVADVGEVWIG